ncbi:uncharacterized protein PV07_05559 [Cladophialophora immunda]|uniref:Ubiquitin-like protease family profile domain-containing protein n=1 Tax=Cladophialophora immunda TaxID=569365 RepID=A0A0D1ZP37_9EURO|nr:uncharacterized protein PV07_05559 [Cladophialophora immunda]KIW29771.1 hypothetical protein PV07_05559 [Cladophialophora immunda]
MKLPWHEVVQSTLHDLSQNGLSSSRKSDVGRRGSDDNPTTAPLVPPRSNASPSQSQRGQMPQTPPRHLTKTISAFLGAHDNAACAPIHIESDDDIETPVAKSETTTPSFPSTQNALTFKGEFEAATANFTSGSSGISRRQSSPRTGSRDEDRLVGGLVRRSTDSGCIEDPMKKPFKTPSGAYKPYNTLNGRSAFLQQRTSQTRVPVPASSTSLPTKNDIHANDHGTPNKKRKVGDWGSPGVRAASVVPLDDGQNLNNSEDELALDTKSKDGKVSGKRHGLRRSNDREENSLPTLRTRDKVRNIQVDRVDRSSPEDEGAFTKGSAQQRKAEKDKILESPPEFSKQPRASRYFSNRQKQNPKRVQTPESPDALQSSEPRFASESSVMNGAPYPEMKTKDLGNLIIGTNSSTAVSKRSKELVKKPAKTKMTFFLRELVYRDLLDSSGYIIELDRSGKEVSINVKDPLLGDDPVSLPRQFNQIIKLRHGSNESPLVSLHFVRTLKEEETMWLRFESHKMAVDFVGVLKDIEKTLKVSVRGEEWMEQAFSKSKSGTSRQKGRSTTKTQATQTSPRKREPTSTENKSTAKTHATRKQIRLVDILDAPAESSKKSSATSAADRKMAVSNMDKTLLPAKRRALEDSPSPQATIHLPAMSQPLTRSHASKEESRTGQGRGETPPKIKASQTGILDSPWTNDLKYPPFGRRAAVVPFTDLKRLDDDEFLNDNLITFFMRYLETHMEKSNPELHRRMYFFNTYFYDALSKTKGRKGINYDAVSRWTKNINLFSRDFIVVPVNENLHWYLAIICNLPFFLGGRATTSGWSEEFQSSDQQSEGERDNGLPTDETQRTLADLSLSDDEKSSQFQTGKRPGRRKAVRRSLPKYDVTKPVIITLDSLGMPRPATCSQLKQYVVSEARDKRNMDIDVTELKGMTAKEIPTQDNFSDCGLYLCMYLEQFVADPYNFVRRILQREENAQQWPRRIHSQDLRSRLRQLILEMHRRQEKEPPEMDEPAIGSILIGTREASRSPPATQRSLTRHDVHEAQKRFDGITRSQHSESREEYYGGSPILEGKDTKTKNAVTEISETPEDSEEENRHDDLAYGQMSAAPLHQTLDTRSNRYSNAEPSHRDAQYLAALQARDVHHARDISPTLDASPTERATYQPRQDFEHHSDKKRRLNPTGVLDLGRRSRSPSRTSELTDYLLGPSSIGPFLHGIESFAAVEKSQTKNLDSGRKNNCPSPEPEIIAERNVESYREINHLGKRKRPSGEATAAESATEHEDLIRSDEEQGLEGPRTRSGQFSSTYRDIGDSQERGRVGRYDGEDLEMLFKM